MSTQTIDGAATKRIVFSVPGLAPQATSPNGRAGWWQKHSDGSQYGLAVLLIAQAAMPFDPDLSYPWHRARVTLTQRAVQLRDHDNFAASFKPGLDAIVRAGIIEDDKPTVIDLSLRAEKVKHRANECVLVEILRLSPGEIP